MCGVNKNKSRTGLWHQKQNQAGLGAGRSKKYANVNYFVRNLLSCFERTSPPVPSPAVSPSLHGVISMNIHIHIRIMFALIIS